MTGVTAAHISIQKAVYRADAAGKRGCDQAPPARLYNCECRWNAESVTLYNYYWENGCGKPVGGTQILPYNTYCTKYISQKKGPPPMKEKR